MKEPLTLERFRALLAAYGARPERWPTEEREQALSLVASSPEAEALLAGEAELDGALAVLEPREVGADLMRRLNEIPVRFPRERKASARFGVVAALGWAMAAAFGMILGARSVDVEAMTAEPGASDTFAVQADDGQSPTTASDQDDDMVALALGSMGDLGEEP